jgi:hypothetical protein
MLPVMSQSQRPHPTEWWHDGHKWRPPVGTGPTKMQLAGQLPGMLLKLTFLIIFMAVILTALFAH